MKTTRRSLLAALGALGSAGLAMAQRYGGGSRWEYLGEANIDGGSDHDRIRVGRDDGYFRRIRIGVERAAVDFDRVVVHFENGADVPVRVGNVIPAGSFTREIDLPGEKRMIDSVEVWYRRGNWANGRKPKIRLYGIRW